MQSEPKRAAEGLSKEWRQEFWKPREDPHQSIIREPAEHRTRLLDSITYLFSTDWSETSIVSSLILRLTKRILSLCALAQVVDAVIQSSSAVLTDNANHWGCSVLDVERLWRNRIINCTYCKEKRVSAEGGRTRGLLIPRARSFAFPSTVTIWNSPADQGDPHFTPAQASSTNGTHDGARPCRGLALLLRH
jgi:hypothetical protein